MFKQINQAHTVLTDEKKRGIYDKYGSFGLYIADQIGEDNIGLIDSVMFFKSIWFKASFKYQIMLLLLTKFEVVCGQILFRSIKGIFIITIFSQKYMFRSCSVDCDVCCLVAAANKCLCCSCYMDCAVCCLVATANKYLCCSCSVDCAACCPVAAANKCLCCSCSVECAVCCPVAAAAAAASSAATAAVGNANRRNNVDLLKQNIQT